MFSNFRASIFAIAIFLVSVVAIKGLTSQKRFSPAVPTARSSSTGTSLFAWAQKIGDRGKNSVDVEEDVSPVIEDMSTNVRRSPVKGPGVDERLSAATHNDLLSEEVKSLSKIYKYQKQSTLLHHMESSSTGLPDKIQRLKLAAQEDIIMLPRSGELPEVSEGNIASGNLFGDWAFEIA
jgi:hypothetical protein